MSRFRQPNLCIPRRGHPLWKGCFFAVAPYWDRGMGHDFGGEGIKFTWTREDIRKRKGEAFLSATNVVNPRMSNYGRTIGRISGDDASTWTDSEYTFSTNALSVMLSFKLLTKGGALGYLARHRNVAFGVLDPGWVFYYSDVLGGYTTQWCNGAGGVQNSNTGFAATVGDIVTVVLVWNPATLRFQSWINGIRQTDVALATNVVPPAGGEFPVIFEAITSFADVVDAAVFVMWNRPLADGEIRQLYVDPYVMWQSPSIMQGLPEAVAPGVAGACDCCCVTSLGYFI